jgi:hypothetical protein
VKNNMQMSLAALALAGTAIPWRAMMANRPVPLGVAGGPCDCIMEVLEGPTLQEGSCITEVCVAILGSANGRCEQPGCGDPGKCIADVVVETVVQPDACAHYTHRGEFETGYAEGGSGGLEMYTETLSCGESVTYLQSVPGPDAPDGKAAPAGSVPLGLLQSVGSVTLRCKGCP